MATGNLVANSRLLAIYESVSYESENDLQDLSISLCSEFSYQAPSRQSDEYKNLVEFWRKWMSNLDKKLKRLKSKSSKTEKLKKLYDDTQWAESQWTVPDLSKLKKIGRGPSTKNFSAYSEKQKRAILKKKNLLSQDPVELFFALLFLSAGPLRLILNFLLKNGPEKLLEIVKESEAPKPKPLHAPENNCRGIFF